jgi:1-acyl-sn-glycerol-3-phosphate acyltransferase
MKDDVWYSGSRAGGLLRLSGGLLDDVRSLRRGWNWGGARPASWAEAAPAVPDRPSNLSWARQEPVRSIRFLIQRFLMEPYVEAMTHPEIDGSEWVQDLERPAILAANHVSHADTPLLLYALSERTRERTAVAAAADYFYRRPWLGRVMSLWFNTFPFSRTGGAQGVLHSSAELIRSGWNLLVFPEGTRSADGRLQEFKPGVGHLAMETRAPVIPMYVRGAHRVMPKGRRFPLPAPVKIRIGRPLQPAKQETSRDFADRVERAVQQLAAESDDREIVGTWIDRWRATRPRDRS